MNDATFRFAKRLTLPKLRRERMRGNVLLAANIHVTPDGVRVAVPVYDPKRDETTVCALTVQTGAVHVYATLQAAKNALHKCGIENYTIVRDGVECWA